MRKFGARCFYRVRNSKKSMQSSKCRARRLLRIRAIVRPERYGCSIRPLSRPDGSTCFRTTFCVGTRKCSRPTGKISSGLRKMAFTSTRIVRCAKTMMSCARSLKRMEPLRDELDYEIDGVVVKVNSTRFRKNLVRQRRLRDGRSHTNIRHDRRRQSCLIFRCRSAEPAH